MSCPHRIVFKLIVPPVWSELNTDELLGNRWVIGFTLFLSAPVGFGLRSFAPLLFRPTYICPTPGTLTL